MHPEKKKPTLAIGIASLFAVVFFSLAIWQLKRYFENTQLLSEKNRFSKQVALELTKDTNETSLRFRPVKLKGKLYRKVFIVIPGKSAGGLSGRHLHAFVTPKDGTISYLVNLGFASSKTNPEAYLKSLPDDIDIEGTCSEIYPLRDAGLYKTGETSEYAIPPLNANVLSTMSQLNVFPGIIESNQPVGPDLEKNAGRVLIKPEMNLVYFLQWVTLTVLTAWWIVKQLKQEDPI